MKIDKNKLKKTLIPAAALTALAAALTVPFRPAPKPVVPVPGAAAAAERTLAEARASSSVRESAPPVYSVGLSTASGGPAGGRILVTGEGIEGVAEEPKSLMARLAEMSGNKEPRVPPVRFTDTGRRKKVVPGVPAAPVKLNAYEVRRPGEEAGAAGMGGKSMIAAPVDYQLFKSTGTWKAFAGSHKGRFPDADFSTEHMLILVSVSELPSGIFKVAGLRKTGTETVVLYSVDPLAMSVGSGANERDFYSAVPVPKKIPVRLQQVP